VACARHMVNGTHTRGQDVPDDDKGSAGLVGVAGEPMYDIWKIERTQAASRDCRCRSALSFQTRVYLVRIRAPDLPGFQAPSAEGVQVGQRAGVGWVEHSETHLILRVARIRQFPTIGETFSPAAATSLRSIWPTGGSGW
jgi:hypothetical protein